MPSKPTQKDDRKLSANDSEVLHRVTSMFAIISILLTAAFCYASTVPLDFGIPDYPVRLTRIITPVSWESGRAFDWIVNLLALIPLGFCWSGTCLGPTTTGPSSLRTLCKVALGCLALAVLAESLQIWLPLRVPSLRDLVALESGAIMGCGLWRMLGARTTTVCSRVMRALTAGRGRRLWRMKWMILFSCLLAVCMAINVWANPAQCFRIYRHRAFSSDRAGVREVFEPGTALLSSTGTALVLFALCGFGVRALELASKRQLRRLHVSMLDGAPDSGVAFGNHHIANERFESTELERAA